MKRQVALGIAVAMTLAIDANADTLSFYGTPGTIDMPNAYVLEDGEIALTSAAFGDTVRNTFTFQITPRLQGSFRYAYIAGFNFDGGDRFDRSFDLSYQIMRETDRMPAIAVGLRDFGGTGVYSSEYLVASKQVGPATITGGLGWGRLAGRNAIDAPLGVLADRFESRPDAGAGGISTTGQLDFDAWFRGDASPFASLSWDVSDKLTIMAEYSPDLYEQEVRQGSAARRESPFNAGLQYRFDNDVTLGAYAVGGTDVGVTLSYTFNPANAFVPGTGGPGPRPILPRAAIAHDDHQGRLTQALREAGLNLEALQITGSQASVRVVNNRYLSAAQAAGRAARSLANSLPPDVATFDITFVQYGMPVSTISVDRRDLEELEFDADNVWKSQTRARIADGGPVTRDAEITDLYPGYGYQFAPYFLPSLFDPDRPLRFETGIKLNAYYSPAPGLILQGEVRQPLYSTIDGNNRPSNSVVPRVRSEGLNYFKDDKPDLTVLTATYLTRPSEDLFGRVTVGYLERMYGGASAELLWYPQGSRLALGAEVNYVAQRDFDVGFGFQDYDTVTGHASLYYDFGSGFQAQIDAGRYLAGDWGATFTLDREFNNGVRVGAFFTLTDMPFEDFGEGSFDKGIQISIPYTWFGAPPTQQRFSQTIRPVTRDGGARVFVDNRLYGLTRTSRGPDLTDNWGLFWR